MILNLANDVRTGFDQESLKVVEITEDLINGFDTLTWSKCE
jgi:hypothetical protein